MTVRVSFDGDKKLMDAIMGLEKSSLKDVDTGLAKMAYSIDREAKKSIQGGARSGRVYKRRSITHKASAPGEPPKTDTGQLVRNITVRRLSLASYDVGSRKGAPHGYFLEFGTRNMMPRPWLTPAVEKVLKNFGKFF